MAPPASSSPSTDTSAPLSGKPTDIPAVTAIAPLSPHLSHSSTLQASPIQRPAQRPAQHPEPLSTSTSALEGPLPNHSVSFRASTSSHPDRQNGHRSTSSASAAPPHRGRTSSGPAGLFTASFSPDSEDDRPRHGLSRVLQKRRHEPQQAQHRQLSRSRQRQHIPTMEFPERLKEHAQGTADGDGDENEELLRPNGPSNGVFMNLNQSIFGLIAAAGSTVNFNNRFEGQSSDEDDGEDEEADDVAGRLDGTSDSRQETTGDGRDEAPSASSTSKSRDKRRSKDLIQSTVIPKLSGLGNSGSSKSHSRLSDNRLLRSLPSLKTKLSSKHTRTSSSSSNSGRARKPRTSTAERGTLSDNRIVEEDELQDGSAVSTTAAHLPYSRQDIKGRQDAEADEHQLKGIDADSIPSQKAHDGSRPGRERSNSVRSIAPVMSRMLEAKAELAATRPSFDLDRLSIQKRRKKGKSPVDDMDVDIDDGRDDEDLVGPSALARKLMEIFDFDKPEEVIDEYPCWLLQSVLLQGYMYITAKHICFYAYLPKKANEVAKSGYLAKSGKRNPKYNRYWFRLKGDVLAYYRDPSNLYFPHGQIDLRYGISATVTDGDKDSVHFQVVTHHRTYYFRADSAPSAKEWVKSLQRVIFRSHNDGDSVKISLPIENVLDVEETQTMVELADTCKIRVIDNDETYAIDDYFFSFFDDGKDAVRVLRILIEDSVRQRQDRETEARQLQQLDEEKVQKAKKALAHAPSSSPSDVHLSASVSDSKIRPTKLLSSVRATLAPVSPISGPGSPRASGELPRSSFDALRSSFTSRRSLDTSQALLADIAAQPRRSFSDGGRRSLSSDQHRRVSSTAGPTSQSKQHQRRHPLSEDFIEDNPSSRSAESLDPPSSSVEDPSLASYSALVISSSENDPSSASQILHGSEIFQSPTMNATAQESTSAPRTHQHTRISSVIKLPGRSQTKKTGYMTAESSADDRTSTDSRSRPNATGTLFSEAAGENADTLVEGSSSSTNLQNLAKMGSYPLQRAGAYAGWLNRQSRRMSSLLATESMGYVEKVSGMWKGGHRHYDEPPASGRLVRRGADDQGLDDDEVTDMTSSRNNNGSGSSRVMGNVGSMYGGIAEDGGDEVGEPDLAAVNERFRGHFALPGTEKLQATYFGYLMRVLPLYGKIYISNRSFCFRSLLPGTRTKLILPLRDIENVTKEKGFRFGFSGLVVVIRGHEELFFEFGQAEMRDDCAITLLRGFESARYLRESGLLNADEKAGAETALAERDALQEAREARQETDASASASISIRSDGTPTTMTAAGAAALTANSNNVNGPTILFDDPRASFLNFKPAEPMRITCLTIGSRGDVQPYIALGKGLQADGHHVRIATHPEFEGWIRSHNLDYGRVEGDPGELMRICIENGTFTLQFLREANSKMRTWLDELLSSAWTACADSDLLIESPSAMAGIHIAERLQIPYFRAFTMPWTRTRAYPHAFIMPEHKMGGAYNYITYVMFDNVFWKATASQINRWRNKTLNLPNTTLEKMQPNKVPFLYNFSPSVVPPPLDYSDWIRVTGYWFLDEGSDSAPAKEKENGKGKDNRIEAVAAEAEESNQTVSKKWTPPQDLLDFIAKARRDKKKLVYVGFGSILVPDPAKMTQEVIDAVLKADVRCILSKGWSDRLAGSKNQGQKPAVSAAKEAHTETVGGEATEEEKSQSQEKEPSSGEIEVPMPAEIFQIKSAPHDWLFAQIDAAAHHGGSGTTGASLRAGIPTIIRPFFGDQFFFGGRVEDLGVGICLKKWGATSFARALWEAANSERMIRKAAVLGEQIRRENGVDTAIQCIYRDMEYAKSLVRAKAGKSQSTAIASPGNEQSNQSNNNNNANDNTTAGADETGYDEEEPEESWTFVGGDDSAVNDFMQQSMILMPHDSSGSSSNKALGSRVLATPAL